MARWCTSANGPVFDVTGVVISPHDRPPSLEVAIRMPEPAQLSATRIRLESEIAIFWFSASSPREQPIATVTGATEAENTEHRLSTQVVPDPHTTPQPPQWLLLFVTLISQPFATEPSQLAKPPLQAPRPQVLDAQIAEAFANVQMFPQRPQLREFVAREVSQPLPGTASQSAKPVRQSELQVPLLQTAEALATDGQAAPQRPQLAGSDARTAHWFVQVACPAGQDTSQRESMQKRPAAQVFPQRPQWDLSLLGLAQTSPPEGDGQRKKPTGQNGMHRPALQIVAAGQRLLHAPQWLSSASTLVQAPLQNSAPGAQTAASPASADDASVLASTRPASGTSASSTSAAISTASGSDPSVSANTSESADESVEITTSAVR